ncbi:molecular chaperone DnaK [Fervidicella metallireducens AeB]|uniref:Molecular chaperone DnaK n=1 Tax=Fervidicella metallireducens AeB TaxID=1403537 RepID=A0A017RUS6_9CLOT|nr:TraR/DksA C4-type zinc finger protein [Fervidicella metallireducens]EYE88432.1 molecular chaperone DnaK [Fervidicella metallireducens AeB]
MERNKLQYFENKLLHEKEKVTDTIIKMKEHGLNSNEKDNTSELSSIDNHHADMATEVTNKEENFALYDNEKNILHQIDDALERIKNGNYGKCELCGNDIDIERLEFLPYCNTCINCENKKPDYNTYNNDRPVEERVLTYPFGRSFKDIDKEYNGYDGEDTIQAVDSFNWVNGSPHNYDDNLISGTVEAIDNVSNQQYKKQFK